MKTRKLNLKKLTIADLTPGEMNDIQGRGTIMTCLGMPTTCVPCPIQE